MGLLSSIFSGLGSALKGRAARKAAKEQAKEERQMLEFDAAQRRKELEARRRWELEDRRYLQESFANYGQFARNQYTRPAFSDITPSPVEAPQSVDPNQQGLRYYR